MDFGFSEVSLGLLGELKILQFEILSRFEIHRKPTDCGQFEDSHSNIECSMSWAYFDVVVSLSWVFLVFRVAAAIDRAAVCYDADSNADEVQNIRIYIINGAHTVCFLYIYIYIQRRAMYLFVFPWFQLCFLWCLSSPGWRWWRWWRWWQWWCCCWWWQRGWWCTTPHDATWCHMMPHDARWYHLIMYSVRMILHKNITCLQIICTTSWASLLYFTSTHPWCLEDCEAKDLALLSFVTELHGVLLKHGPLPLQQMGGMGGNSWCGTPR